MAKLKDLEVGLVLLILFWMISLMTISLSFMFHKNQSCLKESRSLLKNDDTLFEFKLGSMITFLIYFFDDNKLKFQVS